MATTSARPSRSDFTCRMNWSSQTASSPASSGVTVRPAGSCRTPSVRTRVSHEGAVPEAEIVEAWDGHRVVGQVRSGHQARASPSRLSAARQGHSKVNWKTTSSPSRREAPPGAWWRFPSASRQSPPAEDRGGTPAAPPDPAPRIRAVLLGCYLRLQNAVK